MNEDAIERWSFESFSQNGATTLDAIEIDDAGERASGTAIVLSKRAKSFVRGRASTCRPTVKKTCCELASATTSGRDTEAAQPTR